MDVAGRGVAAGRGGAPGGLEVPPPALEDIAAEATGARRGTWRDHTSAQPEKRPLQVVSHIRQVQADSPAFIG